MHFFMGNGPKRWNQWNLQLCLLDGLAPCKYSRQSGSLFESFFRSAPKWSNPHMTCVSYWSQIFKNRLFHGKFPRKDVVRFVCIHSSLYKVNLKRFVPFKVVREDVEKLKTVVDDLYIAAGGVGDPQNFDKSPPSWMPKQHFWWVGNNRWLWWLSMYWIWRGSGRWGEGGRMREGWG